MVSRSLNEQISLNKTSIYLNESASRLSATVGRRTGDATFLKGPVSILRLAQLVAELENSLVAWVRRSIMKKVQFHSCTFTWGHAEGASEWKNIRCLQFKFTLLFIYILSGTFFFLVIPFYRPGKFPLNYRWSQVVPKRLKSGVSFTF